MVAIGVSGHRRLGYPVAVSQVVDQVLLRIRTLYGTEDWTLVSSLAEGADRLVVWRALELTTVRLVVPLPLAPEDYQRDFENTASRAAFQSMLESADKVIQLPPQLTRQGSYLAAGRYVLDRSDVLVAVWDGEPARGMGGTGQIVAEARERGLPLAWIGVSRPDIASISSPRGEIPPISYERFPPGN